MYTLEKGEFKLGQRIKFYFDIKSSDFVEFEIRSDSMLIEGVVKGIFKETLILYLRPYKIGNIRLPIVETSLILKNINTIEYIVVK